MYPRHFGHVAREKKEKCPKSFWKSNSAICWQNICYNEKVNILHTCSSFIKDMQSFLDFRCILKSPGLKLMQYNYNDWFAEKYTLL